MRLSWGDVDETLLFDKLELALQHVQENLWAETIVDHDHGLLIEHTC